MSISIGMVAALVGFVISAYIYRKQKAKKPLMCPRNAPCETVLSSAEATTFGFSNSVLGMVFYVTVFFLLVCLGVGGESGVVETLLGLLTLGGFAFSAYLVWVQHYKIKQWCVWCLGSAAMSTVLFVIAILVIF